MFEEAGVDSGAYAVGPGGVHVGGVEGGDVVEEHAEGQEGLDCYWVQACGVGDCVPHVGEAGSDEVADVLGYLEQQEPLLDQLCQRAEPGGLVSVMAGNANASAVRPAMEQRWADALAAFDATEEIGVLGLPTRAHTVEQLSELLQLRGVEPLDWYGVWLFVDWLDFAGAQLDPNDTSRLEATAEVELEAARRDPYRQLSRIFHLIGRKSPAQ